MLNSSFILKKIKPYLNDKRELSEFEFNILFSKLTRREQYKIIDIMIANDIDYVDEKAEEAKELENVEILKKSLLEDVDYRNLENLKNEQLCVMYKNGDKNALSALIDKNKKFVYRYALKFSNQFNRTNLTVEDLYQEGVMGLIKAADRFDASKDYAFLTYCGYWVKQNIIRNAIDTGFLIRLPVHVYEKIQKIDRYRKRYPNADENRLLQILDENSAFSPPITLEQLREYKMYEELYLDTTSLNLLVGEDKESELLDFIPDEKTPSIEDQIAEEFLHENLMQILTRLTSSEEKVIKLRFGLSGESPKTLEYVGEILGVTRERIRQIEARALRKLRNPAYSKKLRGFYE